MVYVNFFNANADKCHFFNSPFSNGTFNVTEYDRKGGRSEELL